MVNLTPSSVQNLCLGEESRNMSLRGYEEMHTKSVDDD